MICPSCGSANVDLYHSALDVEGHCNDCHETTTIEGALDDAPAVTEILIDLLLD